MSRRVAALVIAAGLPAMLGCGGGGAPAPAAEPLAIGVSNLRISLPVFLAMDRGFFAREGLQVALEPFETAQPMMDAVVARHLDLAGYVAFPISAAAEARSGVGLRHVTMLLEDKAHPISRFLVRSGAGITTLADLPGRRVGILPTAAYQAWLRLLLARAGVDPAVVEVQPLAPAMTAAALASGLVDAVFTNDPAATAAIAAGAAVLLDPEPRVEDVVTAPLPFGSFVVSEAWAAANPARACGVARALDAAIALAATDRAAARASLAAHLPASEGPLVVRYPDALFRASGAVDAGALDRLVARYVELDVLPKGARAVPADLGTCSPEARGAPGPAGP